jgi:hypothetical protein
MRSPVQLDDAWLARAGLDGWPSADKFELLYMLQLLMGDLLLRRVLELLSEAEGSELVELCAGEADVSEESAEEVMHWLTVKVPGIGALAEAIADQVAQTVPVVLSRAPDADSRHDVASLLVDLLTELH